MLDFLFPDLSNEVLKADMDHVRNSAWRKTAEYSESNYRVTLDNFPAAKAVL